MQDFELESFPMGADHSQKVKAAPSETIMTQKVASIYRLQLPFLGLLLTGVNLKAKSTMETIERYNDKQDKKPPHFELTGSILNCCFEVMKKRGPRFLENKSQYRFEHSKKPYRYIVPSFSSLILLRGKTLFLS